MAVLHFYQRPGAEGVPVSLLRSAQAVLGGVRALHRELCYNVSWTGMGGGQRGFLEQLVLEPPKGGASQKSGQAGSEQRCVQPSVLSSDSGQSQAPRGNGRGRAMIEWSIPPRPLPASGIQGFRDTQSVGLHPCPAGLIVPRK